MVHARRLSAICGLLALCSVFSLGAKADIFTDSGTFLTDNDMVTFAFSTATAQNYTFYTTSYAGGMNADGTTTGAGGFDPVLTLFTSTGAFVPNGVGGSDNSCTGVGADPSTGFCEDAYFTETLATGSYILALTEFPNETSTDINGFSGYFASCSPSAPFEDSISCTPRDGNYTVNYTSTAVSTVTPEPPSALLLLLPLAGVVALNRRRLASAASL